MSDNAIESSSVPDVSPTDEDSDEEAGQLPVEPEDWDDALGKFLDLPDGWADEFKQEYNDPLVTLLYAALPDAYIGSTPADLDIDEDSLASAVENLDAHQREGLRKLGVVVFSNFFHTSDTVSYIQRRVNNIRTIGQTVRQQLLTRINANADRQITNTELQNTLAALNDPDGPFADGVDVGETFDDALVTDAPSYINNNSPKPDQYWKFAPDSPEEHVVQITHYEKEQDDGVLRRQCVGIVIRSNGTDAPSASRVVRRSPSAFEDATRVELDDTSEV